MNLAGVDIKKFLLEIPDLADRVRCLYQTGYSKIVLAGPSEEWTEIYVLDRMFLSSMMDALLVAYIVDGIKEEFDLYDLPSQDRIIEILSEPSFLFFPDHEYVISGDNSNFDGCLDKIMGTTYRREYVNVWESEFDKRKLNGLKSHLTGSTNYKISWHGLVSEDRLFISDEYVVRVLWYSTG